MTDVAWILHDTIRWPEMEEDILQTLGDDREAEFAAFLARVEGRFRSTPRFSVVLRFTRDHSKFRDEGARVALRVHLLVPHQQPERGAGRTLRPAAHPRLRRHPANRGHANDPRTASARAAAHAIARLAQGRRRDPRHTRRPVGGDPRRRGDQGDAPSARADRRTARWSRRPHAFRRTHDRRYRHLAGRDRRCATGTVRAPRSPPRRTCRRSWSGRGLPPRTVRSGRIRSVRTSGSQSCGTPRTRLPRPHAD